MKLRLTQPAAADLAAVLDYIASRSPQGARRVQRRLASAFALISAHPHLGKTTDDPTILRRTVPPYPYLVFYEIAADEIIVHAVRHGARDPLRMPGQDR